MKSSISGFPEFLPNEQIVFNRIVSMITQHFESHGFVPMDTAAVERVNTLLAKGNDNEIYGLYRLADSHNAKKDLGLRFDLTVPLARYVAENAGQLIFPHKRYQIAPVWRGERPQYGRYRQFYQCDIDIVGDGDLSLEHDAEIMALIIDVLLSMNIPSFHTKLNNRKILSGFLSTVVPDDRIIQVIQVIDKIDKISMEDFNQALTNLNLTSENVTKIRNFLDVENRGSNEEILHILKGYGFNEQFNKGIEEIETILKILKKINVDDGLVKLSLRLARGLAYYTGNVFETVFNDFHDIGSISGGGRYDGLASMISNKKFPGVGATIGISRLIPKLIETGYLKADKYSTADILVTVQDRNYIGSYMHIAKKMRKAGLNTEVYLQDKSLGAQLTYASKKGIKWVLIANEMELLEERAIIRNMCTREQKTIRTEFIGYDIVDVLKD